MSCRDVCSEVKKEPDLWLFDLHFSVLQRFGHLFSHSFVAEILGLSRRHGEYVHNPPQSDIGFSLTIC